MCLGGGGGWGCEFEWIFRWISGLLFVNWVGCVRFLGLMLSCECDSDEELDYSFLRTT